MSTAIKLLLIATAVAFFQYRHDLQTWFAAPADVAEGPATVTLYATQWCPYCEKSRDLFASLGVEYREHDIETSDTARQQYERLGGGGVPLIVIDGEIVRGFDRERLMALLAPSGSERGEKPTLSVVSM